MAVKKPQFVIIEHQGVRHVIPVPQGKTEDEVREHWWATKKQRADEARKRKLEILESRVGMEEAVQTIVVEQAREIQTKNAARRKKGRMRNHEAAALKKARKDEGLEDEGMEEAS